MSKWIRVINSSDYPLGGYVNLDLVGRITVSGSGTVFRFQILVNGVAGTHSSYATYPSADDANAAIVEFLSDQGSVTTTVETQTSVPAPNVLN